MLDLRTLLGDDDFDGLMHHIALGRYNLLLGAGASADSVDRHGVPMPVGQMLRNEIAAKFDLPDAGDKSLKRVFALASGRTAKDGSSIAAFIKDRFTGTKPASWLDQVLRIQWDSMWTLNVDDTIEVTNQRLGNGARQRLTSVSWTDRHYQADRRRDEVVLVHLHGKAHRSNRSSELIFDISGYTASLQEHHRWLKIFGDDYPTKPFIIIGASIDEEIDLQDVFSAGRVPNMGAPSLIILRDIDEFQASEYRSYGLIPVRATGEDFLASILEELPEYLNRLTDDELGVTEATPYEAVRFMDQWKRLSREPAPLRPKGHDVYLGHEPKWYDAVRDFLSTRVSVKSIMTRVDKLFTMNQTGAVIVLGDAFSGKSSVLFRSASELLDAGRRPWLFQGDSALDVDAAIYWLQRQPKAVLFLDNSSDFARDAKELMERGRSLNIPVRIVMFERARRARHVVDSLAGEEVHEVKISSQLSDAEIDRLIETLGKKRRLGVLTNMSKTGRRDFFRVHDRKLFSAMAALEDGRGFQQRVADELANASSRPQRNLLAAVALSSRLGYPLPFELTRTSAEITPVEAQNLVSDQLADLLESSADGIRTRHRIFGELLIDELSIQERKVTITRLALSLAPYVSPQAIRETTLHYRIARGLMGADILSELLKSDSGAVLSVYEDLREAYDWNARYWDQRALAAAESGAFEEAFSWAEQAIDRKRDALSLTTTGKVLMLRAIHEARSGAWPGATFEKAEGYLYDARKLEGKRAEYPIETFLTYINRLVILVPNRDAGVDNQVRSMWVNWFNAILTLDEGSQTRLDRIRRESVASWAAHWPEDTSVQKD